MIVEMKHYGVSVIIPVYNAEQHIKRCCESLFAQSLRDIEYIFVNDGSSDQSVPMIKDTLSRYPNRKSDVKIIDRKENRGVAYTRQEGLAAVAGEYVIHCDSDDWVEKNMYETLYCEGKKSNADVVCCGFYIDLPDKSRTILPNKDNLLSY